MRSRFEFSLLNLSLPKTSRIRRIIGLILIIGKNSKFQKSDTNDDTLIYSIYSPALFVYQYASCLSYLLTSILFSKLYY